MTTTQFIEIRDSTDKPVAFLSPQADGLRADTATIDNELNGNCTLSFELPLTSDKWTYITDAYEFLVDGKRFILLKPDTEEVVRDGKKVWGKVTAQEKWVELDKEYVTVSNDPNSPGPAWSAVIIVSGGTPAGGYAAGSAGSALSYLLAGSDWTTPAYGTTGACDVTGTFDLETERISVLANIQKVQELWGGNLFWDSENKTVSLRDETLYQNYTGFQVRYAKNLKGITRTVNRDLVTRLYPFGYEDLNIGTVNGGVIYLDNNTYSSKVYEGQWVNQDITDATELKTKAITELAKLCKPRYTYTITMLDLSVKPQWAHETFVIGDMVDVIDEVVGANDRLRITQYKYNIFQKWKCSLTVGEPLEKLSSRISDTSAVTEKVLVSTGTTNLFKAIINTKATQINGASGDYSLVDGVSTWWGSVDGVRNGKMTRITPNGMFISSDGGVTPKLAVDGDGIYGNVVVCSELTALSSGDGYTKVVDSGLKVLDSLGATQVHVGQYEAGKFGLLVGASPTNYKLLFDGTDLKIIGDVTANAGHIGGVSGWTIAAKTLTGASDSKIVSGILQSSDWSTVAGSQLDLVNKTLVFGGSSSYKFKVESDGSLTAHDATLTGTFTSKYGSYIVAQLLKNASDNGELNLYNSAGNKGIVLGMIDDAGDFNGGHLKLYHFDNATSPRIMLTTGKQSSSVYANSLTMYNTSNQKIIDLYTAANDSCLDMYYPGGASVNLRLYSGNSDGSGRIRVKGDMTIGTGYFGYTPPTNGAIIQGYLGVGTNNPLYLLHVEGQSKLNGSVGIGMNPDSGYSLVATGNIATNGGYIYAQNGFVSSGGFGVTTGTFTTADGKTVTVSGGIITNIV